MATIKRVDVRPVLAPLERPVKTAAGDVTHSPLALVDLYADNDIVGRSYIFTYTPGALKPVCELINSLAALILGKALAPLSAEAALIARLRLLGDTGLTGIAVSAIDMACWDALAKLAGLPLARLLGGDLRPVPCYLSTGMDGPDEAEKCAIQTVEEGFDALKIKIGYPTLEEDLEAIHRAKAVLKDDRQLMVDYNQSFNVAEAIRRCRALDECGLAWIEEPTRQDDYEGTGRVASEVKTPIQMGENWYGTREMAKCLAARGSDFVMLDLMKIGGVTGWLRGARLAEAAGLAVSSHLFQEYSAHLMCVTPTAHWVEYLKIADPVLAQPLRLVKGRALLAEEPGAGVSWNEAAVERYRVT